MQTQIPLHTLGCKRRTVVGVGLALAPWLAGVAKADDAASAPPQPGDHFVFVEGDKKGQVIKPEDLTVGGPQVQAYPADPKSGVVRNGSRLNLVMLVRLDPAGLSGDTRGRAADGVVAYSGVCTHQGCPANMWSKTNQTLFCSCHSSEFDPKNSGEVVAGPAPRPLPALPLKLEDGVPVVSGPFTERVGSEIG